MKRRHVERRRRLTPVEVEIRRQDARAAREHGKRLAFEASTGYLPPAGLLHVIDRAIAGEPIDWLGTGPGAQLARRRREREQLDAVVLVGFWLSGDRAIEIAGPADRCARIVRDARRHYRVLTRRRVPEWIR
jgi:hypothetical protein